MTQHNKSGAGKKRELLSKEVYAAFAEVAQLGLGDYDDVAAAYIHRESDEDGAISVCVDVMIRAMRAEAKLVPVAPVADAGVKRPELDRLWKLAEAATQGPWKDWGVSVASPEGNEIVVGEELWKRPNRHCRTNEEIAKDISYIAAASPDVILRFISYTNSLELQLTQAQGKNVELAERVKELREALEDVDSTLCRCRHDGENDDCNCDIHAAHRLIHTALSSAASGKDGE